MSLPHASGLLDEIRRARTRAGHLFVGLDYDGTLTGIVPRPEDAHLPEPARAVLHRLVARPDTTGWRSKGRDSTGSTRTQGTARRPWRVPPLRWPARSRTTRA